MSEQEKKWKESWIFSTPKTKRLKKKKKLLKKIGAFFVYRKKSLLRKRGLNYTDGDNIIIIIIIIGVFRFKV